METIPEEHHPGLAPATLTFPSPDSVLARLEQIDARLRQLERQRSSQSPPGSLQEYFASDLRGRAAAAAECPTFGSLRQQKQQVYRTSSLSSAVEEASVRGTLMDRLRLLENRIVQLSYELDKGTGAGSAPAEVSPLTEEDAATWLLRPLPHLETQDPVALASYRLAGDRKRSDESQKQPKVKKAKDYRHVMDAVEKASGVHWDAKRRTARTQLYKRWFSVGC